MNPERFTLARCTHTGQSALSDVAEAVSPHRRSGAVWKVSQIPVLNRTDPAEGDYVVGTAAPPKQVGQADPAAASSRRMSASSRGRICGIMWFVAIS